MEIWDLYDASGCLLNRTHIRGDELPDDGYHKVVHVWIKNSENKILISQRSAKRISNPLKFECVGGSVIAGEDSLKAALRETKEEVGIDLNKENGKIIYSKTRGIIDGQKFNDIMDVWLFEYDGEVLLSNATTDEVESVCWLSINEVLKYFEDEKMVKSLDYFFDIKHLLFQNKNTQNNKKIIKKSEKNKKKTKKLSKTSKYFDFYDDVKAGCHKVFDW